MILRDLTESDLPILFDHQNDPEASRMAAFLPRDLSDRDAFMTHWKQILVDPTLTMKAILWNGQVAGSIGSFLWDGKPQVTYWLGKAFWGNGIATLALTEFLCIFNTRPLYASAARDNVASTRVLEKCGFAIRGSAKLLPKPAAQRSRRCFSNWPEERNSGIARPARGLIDAMACTARQLKMFPAGVAWIRSLSLAMIVPKFVAGWDD
jgi:RimJ/RimL family protein N-acetyltransferase